MAFLLARIRVSAHRSFFPFQSCIWERPLDPRSWTSRIAQSSGISSQTASARVVLKTNLGDEETGPLEMHLYDLLAPAYDPVFESIFLPFRTRALKYLPPLSGATILDLACGTGQNFPLLAEHIGVNGTIIGVDISSGMLSGARRRANPSKLPNLFLGKMDATRADYSKFTPVDSVVCTYGFTSVRGWEAAFRSSWELLKPGGGYLIHDIDAETRTLHVRAVELATRSRFSDKVWQPLQNACLDFRMDYIDPSAHLFGGRLFVAYGTKPPTPTGPPCPS
jgi:ubiquinone/menaquinone biosynthesis C-methylase UbiE